MWLCPAMKRCLFCTILIAVSFALSACIGSGKPRNKSAEKETATASPASKLTAATDSAAVEHPVVNVYLENSGSMNGYVDSGKTEFQQAVYNYLCDMEISGIPSEMNLFYINSQIISKGNVIADFINKLNPHSFKSAPGNKATTDVAEIVKMILDKTDQKTVSVFISDCIFSPGSQHNPQAYLTGQQIGIKKAVADYLAQKGTLACVVYQLSSGFQGMYYDYRNKARAFKGDRPYYIWMFGNPVHIALLKNSIPEKKFAGNGVEHAWTVQNVCLPVDYGLLPANKNNGAYDRLSKTSVGNLSRAADGRFMFTIGADMRYLALLYGEDYITDTRNYVHLIDKATDEAFFGEISTNTVKNSPYTHNIHVISDKKPYRGDFKIALACTVPQWIYDITDDDDSQFSDANVNKTYGLKYICDGIYQAYTANNQDNHYAVLTLDIR